MLETLELSNKLSSNKKTKASSLQNSWPGSQVKGYFSFLGHLFSVFCNPPFIVQVYEANIPKSPSNVTLAIFMQALKGGAKCMFLTFLNCFPAFTNTGVTCPSETIQSVNYCVV